MDEALVDVFNLAKSEGYQGDINSFKELISTDKDAYNMAFNSFTSRGYTGGEEDFSSLIQISQPKPKDAGTYQINNTPAKREDVMLNLQNPEFKQNVQNGNIILNVQNDESLRPYINGNVVSSSDGEFTVDVSGTVNLGGKQYSYDELTTQLNGDTDRAIKMFVNQTPIDAVIKSPQKTKLELRLSPETEKKQEQEKLQKDALKSKGDLYNKYLIEDYYLFARNDDYESSSGMIDETFAAIGDGLDAVEKLVQFDYVSEEKANNREAVEKQQEKVTDIVDRIIDPLYQENKSKYVNDGKVNQDYTIEDNEGFLIPNGAKILKEISKPESSEYIKDVNLRMKYLSDIVSTIDLNINAPQEKVQEQSEENYTKEYGKSFQEEIDESARLEFKEKYADDIDKITSSYTTEVDFLTKKANSDIENYTAPLNKQYNTTLQAYQQKAKQLEQEKAFATSIGDLKIIESQLDKLTNDYNDVVGQRTKQQLSFISKRNNKLNNQIQLLNDKRNNSLKELSTDFSKTFNVSEELLDKYNDVYKKSFDEVYDKSAQAKEKVMIARTKFGSPDDNIIEMLGGEPTRLGARIANVTLSALLETAYNTSTATFGVDPESAYFLRQESKQRVPAPVGLKKFSDLGGSEGVYRLLESTGQLVGSMTPALGAAAVTAVATRNLPMATRMILIGGAQWGAESENLASRAYNDAIERTGSVSTAKKARSETLDLQIALLPTYYFQALPFVGGFSKIANPLLRVLAGGTLEYSTEIIQELPQQLGEESIFKYGEFEKMGEFFSKGKFEEVAVNVLPTFGIGTVGSMNADAGLQMSRLIEKYPEMSRQYLANFVYQNSDKRNLATGKAKAQFALSTLYTNGKIDEETAIKLGLFVNSITNNNSLSYTILNAKRSDLKVALEQETDEVKQTIIKKQLNELSSEMENILLGKESNITEIKIGDVRYQFTPSEVENTNVVEDIQSLKNNIEQSTETTTETTTQQRLDNRTKKQKGLFGDQHIDKKLPYGAAEISDITTTDKNGVTTATYVNPETNSVDVIISATSEGNFVGYTRVYENGKPTDMFSAKMQTSESGVFKNIITSAENTLPDNAEVVETTTISTGGLKSYNKSRLVEKVDEDGNVVTRPTRYSDATKESVKEKGEAAYKPFKTTDKSAAEAEIAKIKEAYPGINTKIIETKVPPLPPQPGKKPGKTVSNQYTISIDLPVLVKPEGMQKTTETTTEETVEETPLVTDESGEVVTVYRGGKPASGVQYYTSDQKLAEGIGEGKGEGVQKATVRMANPWTPESLDVNNAPQWMQDWVRSQEEFTTVDEETMAAEEIPMEQAIQEIKDMQLSFRDVGLWQSFVNEALEHHDGIIAFDPSEDMATDKKIYITKSPEQVVTEEVAEEAAQETSTETIVYKENRKGGELFPYKGEDYVIQEEFEGQNSAFKIVNSGVIDKETIPNKNLKSFQNPLAVDKQVVKKADISIPIIIGDNGKEYFVLDGNHRLTKAMLDGKDIEAYVLTEQQTKSINLKNTEKIDAIQETSTETTEETTEELGSEVEQIAKLEAERTKTEDTTEETTEDTTDELTSVDVAKDQLKSAWESWKEQQKKLGVVFDPQSKADEDIALARAIIDYLREIGAKNLSDVNRTVRQFTNNGITVNSKGARYLLFESKKDTKGKVVSQALNKYYDNQLNRRRTNFVQTIQNSYIKLLKTQKTAAKLGIKITDNIDVILNKELQQNRTVAGQQKINDLFANFIKEYVQKAGLTIEELGLYMYAIHAPIRNRVLKERAIKNGETENIDDLSGMTDEQAKEILESIPDNMKPVYEALAKKFREQTLTETVKVFEDSGKITKEKAKELLDNFEGTYVPLRVEEDMLGEFDVNSSPKTIRTKGKVIYKAKGSNFFTAEDRVNPVVQAHISHLKAISISEEQRTFKSLVGLAKAINDSDVFKVVTRAKTRPDKGIEGSIDGKTAYVVIQDQELFDIMNANDGQLYGSRLSRVKMLQSFNSWFRTVNTLANPSFIVTNFERDLQSALINISSEDVKNLGSQFIKNVPSAVRGLTEYQLGKRDTEWAKIYQELIDAGGQISWQDLGNIDKVKKEIKKIENKYKNKKGKNDLLNYSKEMYSAVGNLMGGLNNVAEMSSRLAAFQAARDAGMTDARAAQLALNLTVNFQKKGTAGVVINALWVFSNAGIQGSAVILKNLSKKGKGGNRARIIAGSIVAASYMNALLNDMFDDDEDEESYADDDSIQMLSDYQRERNMIFMIPKELGGTGDKITVPLPYGYNVFWVAGQAAYDFTAGKKDLGQSMSMMGGAVMNAFNPIGGTGKKLADYSPTILKPALEIYTNRDYKDDPIKPDYDIPGMAKRRESSKYFKSVSPASKEITDFLNEFTGGDEIVAGDIDISPESIDHLSKFIAGGAGTFLNNAITTGISTVDKEPISIRNIPFVRKHYSEPYPEARVNFIYDVYENRETQQLTPYDEQLFINSLVYSLKNDLIEPEKVKKIIKGYINSKDLQDRANQEVYPMFTEKELRKTKKIEKESLKKLKKLIDE